jgi:hypothetical protein
MLAYKPRSDHDMFGQVIASKEEHGCTWQKGVAYRGFSTNVENWNGVDPNSVWIPPRAILPYLSISLLSIYYRYMYLSIHPLSSYLPTYLYI